MSFVYGPCKEYAYNNNINNYGIKNKKKCVSKEINDKEKKKTGRDGEN